MTPICANCSVTDCKIRWYTQLPPGLKVLNTTQCRFAGTGGKFPRILDRGAKWSWNYFLITFEITFHSHKHKFLLWSWSESVFMWLLRQIFLPCWNRNSIVQPTARCLIWHSYSRTLCCINFCWFNKSFFSQIWKQNLQFSSLHLQLFIGTWKFRRQRSGVSFLGLHSVSARLAHTKLRFWCRTAPWFPGRNRTEVV
jgi:hypothetical protein